MFSKKNRQLAKWMCGGFQTTVIHKDDLATWLASSGLVVGRWITGHKRPTSIQIIVRSVGA